jgi:hypothetical protein
LDPLELRGETLGGAQAQNSSIGIEDVSGYVQAASSTELYAASHSECFDASEQITNEASHLIGHALLNEMSEPGGHSASESQPAGQYPLDSTSTIRDIMVLEVRRLHSHLYSLVGRYICRVMDGTPLVGFSCTSAPISHYRITGLVCGASATEADDHRSNTSATSH